MGKSVNQQTVNLIRRKEGLLLSPYLCPAKVPTIGIGTTKYPPWYRGGAPVRMTDPPITPLLAEQFLDYDLDRFEDAVEKAIKVPMTNNQYGAMVSLTYNIGEGAFAGSSVVRLMNKGNTEAAARAFALWTKADLDGDGQIEDVPGLVVRRREEQALFQTPDPRLEDAVPPPPEPLPLVEMPPELPMPQKVANLEKGPVESAVKSKSIVTDGISATILAGGAGTIADKVLENPDAVVTHITTATTTVGAVKALILAVGGWKIALMVGGFIVAGLLAWRAIRYFRKLRNFEVISK